MLLEVASRVKLTRFVSAIVGMACRVSKVRFRSQVLRQFRMPMRMRACHLARYASQKDRLNSGRQAAL
jgi:hypothetical protein